MIAALSRPSIARIVRGPRVWIALAAWCTLAVVFALVERGRGAAHGADHVLVETYGALVVPLLAYVFVGATVASQSLRGSAASLVALGATPTRAAAAPIAVAGLACAASCAILGAVVAAIAHGVADPPRLHDALTTAYAGALGGAAYAAWFAFGASFGRRGGGRTLLLAIDWALGAASGASALASPRGHLRNLLGGAPPMDLTQHASAFALIGIAVVCTLGAMRRSQ